MYFDDMMHHVHTDDKWFQLTNLRKSFLLSPNETAPHRHVKSKRFISKVMFLCAIARSRYDHTRNGKLGIWTFVEVVLAKRISKNRPAGTSELKPVNVTRETYKKFLIDKGTTHNTYTLSCSIQMKYCYTTG